MNTERDKLLEELTEGEKVEYEKLLKEKKKEYEKLMKEKIEENKNRLNTAFEEDKLHRIAVNMCCYPFCSNGYLKEKTGYFFIRADPLYELGRYLSDFDFLLYNPMSNVAIFGEAKGSLSSHQVNSEVSDVSKKINVVESNKEYIENEIIGDQIKKFEYVLAVPPYSDQKVISEIRKKLLPVSVWSLDMGNRKLTLKTFTDRENRLTETVAGQVHSDSKLKSELFDDVDTEDKFLDLFPRSPPFTKISKCLVTAKALSDSTNAISRENILDVIDKMLYYLTDETKQTICEEIIKGGIDIEILHEEEGRYTIKSEYSDSLEQDILDKWIDKRSTEKAEFEVSSVFIKEAKEIIQKRKSVWEKY